MSCCTRLESIRRGSNQWRRPYGSSRSAIACVDGVSGGYIAARLAPDRPVKHALALGVIGVVMSTAGVVATWNKGPEFGPKWYPLALVVIALPCALIGGKLRERQLRARA